MSVPSQQADRVAGLHSTLRIRRAAAVVAVAVAAVASLAILRPTGAAPLSPAVATARASAGSLAASHDGLFATLAPRPVDQDLFDGRRPDGPTQRTTQLPIFLLVAAGVIAGLAAGRRSSPRTDASPRRPPLAVRGARAPPVLSH